MTTQYFFLLFLAAGLKRDKLKKLGSEWGEKGCMCIKDWFKPLFLPFVNRTLDLTLNTHGRICTHPTAPVF